MSIGSIVDLGQLTWDLGQLTWDLGQLTWDLGQLTWDSDLYLEGMRIGVMNRLILISTPKGSGFQPIISGQKCGFWLNIHRSQ